MFSQDQLIGTRFEKCVVERLIGRGGYGLTFLAFDEELQEHRVIKVSQDLGMDEASRRRHLKTFLEEGLILSRLKHPQIVTLRGQGDKHGHRYMILDYIQGYSLRNVLDIVGQRQEDLGCAWQDLLDPVSASALILSALYPMEYAHRANVHLPDREIFGVAHRDISPGNLILGVKGNEKGRLVLIDFGTAKTTLTENVTVDQNLVGTIPYMGKARLQKANNAEQKAQYQSFWKDFRETQHDIHAIGVLYYQLLTGRLPFSGETSPQIIVKILDPEVYSQCQLEIASAHSFASGVLRKCLVYHDFSMPLGEQPYQYPDAASMRPDMEEVFNTLSGGRSVNDVLIALGKKLAHPDLWIPIDGLSVTDPSSSGVMPTLPAPMDYADKLPFSFKRRTPVLYASVLAGGLALVLGAAWWFGPRQSRVGAEAGDQPAAWAERESPDAPGNPGSDPSPKQGPASPALGRVANTALQRETLEKLDGIGTSSGKARNVQGRAAQAAQKPGAPGAHQNSAPGQSGLAAAKGLIKKIGGESLTAEEWNKESYVLVQTLIRSEDPSAFEKISTFLSKHPDSPDLRLLRCQLVLMRNPASTEARRDLVDLQGGRPEFMHPSLFQEQAMYLLWKTDADAYEAQKIPANRIKLMKSANAYLSEFQPIAAYQNKIKGIRDRLPH